MFRRSRYVLAAAGAVATVVALSAGPAHAAPSKPDGKIRVAGQSSFVGKNVYNSDGTDQTVTRKIAAGKSAKFEVKAKNNGQQIDDIRFQASEGCADFSIQVFYQGVNRTLDNNTGALIADDVFIGASTGTFKVKVKSDGGATSGDVCPVGMYFNTVAHPGTLDVPFGKAKIK